MVDFNGGTGVRTQKTAELVAAKIRRAIILGEIAPGDNLPAEAKLAAEHRGPEAASVLREHVQREYEALKADAVIPALTADFHRLLLEQSGNQTLALIAIALRELVEKHQTLAHRRQPVQTDEASRKRSRLGVRSHEKLVELIEQEKGQAAEDHWRLHMARTGPLYLDRLSQATVVDILEN